MKLLWLWLTAMALGAQIAACTPLVLTPTPNPFEVHGPSLQPWAQPQLETVGPLPRYTIWAELDASGDRLEGRMSLVVPNASTASWPDLVFRLYPNLPHYRGVMGVTKVQVNGEPATTEFDSQGTALRIWLPTPLAPAEEVTVSMAFSVDLSMNTEGYTLFGWEDGILSLPGFYPTLAVRREMAASDADSWAMEIPPLFADVLFNPVALYELEFIAPPELTVVGSGTTMGTTADQDRGHRWRFVGGPLRDMTILASDRWQSVSETAAGTKVTSYYPAGAEAAGQAALFYATAALRLYSDLYGRYPYTEFDVVAAPLGVRGMEYSGLVTIGQDVYSRDRDQLAFLVAHETAHQWWYAQVGNDPLTYPWLDEGPAEYAAFDYYRDVYGQAAAEALLSGRWQTPYAVAAADGIDGPVDQAASAMSAANYELLAYTKAALFFDALRDQLGDEMYIRVMQTYVDIYRWQIVTPQQFFGVAQIVSGADLNPLAEEWLR